MSSLAAGAIGSLVTIAVALIVRLWTVPAEIQSHDRRAHERDDDLASWVADSDLALRIELHTVRANLAPQGLLDSGEYGWKVWRTKEAALHQWRDQERQAHRDVSLIYDREGPLHRLRRWRLGPPYELVSPAAARPVIDAWRAPPSSTADHGRPPVGDDPTLRTLERTAREAPGRTGEYQ